MADVAVLTAINRDVWTPFRAAYAKVDAEAYLALHTPDLVRIEAGRAWLGGLDEYGEEVRTAMARLTALHAALDIQFRFAERITGPDAASERGMFQLTVSPPDDEARVMHGCFHVVLRKGANGWRIAVDYDSDEGGTATAERFETLRDVDDTEAFSALTGP